MIRVSLGAPSRVPDLNERAGGAQHHKRQANGGGEQPENAPHRINSRVWAPKRVCAYGKKCRTRYQKRDVQQRLPRRRQSLRRDIGIKIAEQQSALEKYQAGCPDRRRASEPGKNYLREERLNPKQEKRTKKNRRRQQQRMRPARLSGRERRSFCDDLGMGLRTSQAFSSLRFLCAFLCVLCVKSVSFSCPKNASNRAAQQSISRPAISHAEACFRFPRE